MAQLPTMAPVDTVGFDDFVRETGPALWRTAWRLVDWQRSAAHPSSPPELRMTDDR